MAGFGIGAGTSLTLGATLVGKITKIKPAKTSVAKVSKDAFDSPLQNGKPVEDWIGGWITPGEWEIETQHVDSVYTTLRGKLGNDSEAAVVTKPNGATYGFNYMMTSLSPEIAMKDLCVNSFTIQVVGGAIETFTAGS